MAPYVPHHPPQKVASPPCAGIGPAAPPADLVPPARDVHPAASPDELDLLEGWYTWSWHVDREVRRRIASGAESAEAGDAVAWLVTLTAASATRASFDPAETSDPLRRGIAELWPRTVASRSAAWADRFAEALANRSRALVLHYREAATGECADPIEYLRRQRSAGGGEVAAHLVEHALGIDVASCPACEAPAKSLTEAFADVLGLRQALSHSAPPHRPSPRHAELLTRVLDSRLRHFAHLAATPPRAPHGTDGSRRGCAGFHGYADGLRVFLAADTRWRGRHPSPVPAPSVQRPSGRPLGPTAFGAFTVPEFFMPYPERINPHLQATAEHARAWARRMGLFTGGLAPGTAPAWSESRYDAIDFPLFTAMAHPQASRDELDLITDWYVWGFHFDDLIAKTFKHGDDPDGAQCWIDRVTSLFATPTRDFRPRNCVERGLADLFPRSARALAQPLRDQFYQATLDMVNSWTWELANAKRQRVPDPIEYLEIRRRTGGGAFFVTLARYAGGDAVPAALLDTEHMRGIAEAVIDSVLLRNDILSYHQEIAYEGELANSLVIAQHAFGYDLQTAVDHVNELVSRRLHTFASLTDRLPATGATREGVDAYVDALKAFVAGDLGWSLRTARHAQAGTPVAQRTHDRRRRIRTP